MLKEGLVVKVNRSMVGHGKSVLDDAIMVMCVLVWEHGISTQGGVSLQKGLIFFLSYRVDRGKEISVCRCFFLAALSRS